MKIIENIKFFTLILSLLLFTGCATKQIESNYSLKKGDTETVFVMGVNSDRYKLLMWPGDVEGEAFVIEDAWKNAAHYDTAKNGYVVSSVTGNDHVGFKAVELLSKDKKRSVLFQKFCQGMKTPVFSVPAGKVVYVGDINFIFEKGFIKYSMHSNFKKAKEFINKNYPNLKGKLEKTDLQFLYSMKPCQETNNMYIPIYIPM